MPSTHSHKKSCILYVLNLWGARIVMRVKIALAVAYCARHAAHTRSRWKKGMHFHMIYVWHLFRDRYPTANNAQPWWARINQADDKCNYKVVFFERKHNAHGFPHVCVRVCVRVQAGCSVLGRNVGEKPDKRFDSRVNGSIVCLCVSNKYRQTQTGERKYTMRILQQHCLAFIQEEWGRVVVLYTRT